MYLLEEKYEFIKVHQVLSNMVGCLIENTISNSNIWDFILLKEYNKIGIKSPTKYNINTNNENYMFDVNLNSELKPIKLCYKTQ